LIAPPHPSGASLAAMFARLSSAFSQKDPATVDRSLNVIIPLGGVGTRFRQEGYVTRPKPFVPVLGKPMILWVLESLCLQEKDSLVIVFDPNWMNSGSFMREVVGSRYPHITLVELEAPTRGPAETVLLGLRALSQEKRLRPTLLADGDTFYTVDVVKLFRSVARTNNAVFCFRDEQEQPIYSYIELDASENIVAIREKVKISDWANTGCYCFKDGCELARQCEDLIQAGKTKLSQDQMGEFYISGVIAAMIAKGAPFRSLKLVPTDVHVLGTPVQVRNFCATWPKQPLLRFVFELEGVLVFGPANSDPRTWEPVVRTVDVCRRLKRQRHSIIIQTVRPALQAFLVSEALRRLDIPFDELLFDQPLGDFRIGGTSSVDASIGDLDLQLGFYPSELLASPQDRDIVDSVAAVARSSTLFDGRNWTWFVLTVGITIGLGLGSAARRRSG